MTGFSAQRAPSVVSATGQLGNWTVTAPYFGDASFDPVTGTFTVPETGRYSIKAIISYSTTAAISVELGPGVDPAFVVRRINDATDLITGLLPVLDVGLLLLTVRVILGSSTVTLVGDLELNAGDEIGIFYVANGLTIDLNLGGVAPSGTVWSIHRIA